MIKEPPPFQESATCDVCGCNFSAFRRRHHCRCCGRTLCHEHSSNQMALPQFGVYSHVRVCGDCFNDFASSRKESMQPSLDGVDSITNNTKMDIGGSLDSNTNSTAENLSALGIANCKCGMPLCICEAPSPSIQTLPTLREDTSSTPKFNPKPMKMSTDKAKNRASTSNSNFCKMNKSNFDSNRTDYEVNGEGLREAVKNGDIYAVKKLLNEGVDANYRDKQGFSLLHLAAVFNHTDIVFALIDSGASLEYKNPQGETPLDCAPVTLQHKIRTRIEESQQ